MKKKTQYPQGYIGRPKPMKTKKFEFHKPTKKFWIKASIVFIILAFLTYIILRLIDVGKAVQPEFDYYEYDEEKQPSSYVLENQYLKFELDTETTMFTVLQKNTGKIWYSNPQGADSDKLALAKEKNNMKSTVLVKFSTENGSDDTYDVYTNSVKRKFYNVTKKGEEITVDYTVGQMDREYIFPPMMYQEEFDKWTKGLKKAQVSAVGRVYHKYTMSNVKGEARDEMLAKYPGMKDGPVYIVFENVQKHVKTQMEELFAKQGFTYEDYVKSKEQYKETSFKEMPAFNVTLKYKLSGNSFIVTVPFKEISYRLKYPITQLSILPYFGAADSEDKGFIFIPEGSGALIDFNNGKTRQNGYYADCYGWDYAVERSAVITETRASYPVFGIAYPDSSFISVVNKGAEYAGFTAEIAGKLGSYNYARADYTMLHREQYEVSARSQNSQFVYEKQLPQDQVIEQSFTFIDSGSYVDMAKEYQKTLFAGSGTKKLNEKKIPLAVELIGAIEKEQHVLGMPKVKPYKLTSYEQAADIITTIEKLGLKDVNYKLSGFINGGIRQQLMKKVKFIKQLGGKAGFKKLVKKANATSAKLYVDGSVQTAYRSKLSNGFFSYRDSARFVSDELCLLYEYSPIWYGKNPDVDTYYLLNSKLRNKGSKVLTDKLAKFGVNVSYHDNGELLSSDFNERKPITRQDAKNVQLEGFANAKQKGCSIMINGGNDYAIKDVDFITNMKLHGNSYAIIDRFVPFYQIALHGYVNYASYPINLSYEKNQLLLESAEVGSGLMFTFMQSGESELQETNYTEYYSSCFDSWKDQLVQIYTDYNSKLAPVVNSLITDHSYVSDNVTKTTFENGYVVYVNFGYSSYTTPSGIYIPERDYRVMKVED